MEARTARSRCGSVRTVRERPYGKVQSARVDVPSAGSLRCVHGARSEAEVGL